MRGCNERKKTGIGIGIIIVCFIVLSITSFTLFIYGSDLRTYSDATCKTIDETTMKEETSTCACDCICSSEAPVIKGCVDYNNHGGLIKYDHCLYSSCSCNFYGDREYCKACTYKTFEIKIRFNYYNPVTQKTYNFNVTKIINDDINEAYKWMKKRTDEFPCSYNKKYPLFRPKYGSVAYTAEVVVVVSGVVTFLSILTIITTLCIGHYLSVYKNKNYIQM